MTPAEKRCYRRTLRCSVLWCPGQISNHGVSPTHPIKWFEYSAWGPNTTCLASQRGANALPGAALDIDEDIDLESIDHAENGHLYS
jgi:hypothetical protein